MHFCGNYMKPDQFLLLTTIVVNVFPEKTGKMFCAKYFVSLTKLPALLRN